MLSRSKPAVTANPPAPTPATALEKKTKELKLETFIANRDYTGAVTMLEVIYFGGVSLVGYPLHLADYPVWLAIMLVQQGCGKE